MYKLTEISFNSSDFEQECSKEHFQKLLADVGDLLEKPEQPNKFKSTKKKVKLGKKKLQPYQSLRVQRPGMTMFDMMKATDTPEKVVIFLQERGCLPKSKCCPDCNEPMKLTDRGDTIQSKVFRCKKRHGETRCQRTITMTVNTFFYGMHMSLFTALWLLWGFCEGMKNEWFIRHLGLSSATVTD